MKVKIRYCGQLKQAAGCAAEEVDPATCSMRADA